MDYKPQSIRMRWFASSLSVSRRAAVAALAAELVPLSSSGSPLAASVERTTSPQHAPSDVRNDIRIGRTGQSNHIVPSNLCRPIHTTDMAQKCPHAVLHIWNLARCIVDRLA